MNINDYDNTIDNNMFLSKVDNIFILIYTGVMFDDPNRFEHKVSSKVFNKYKSIIDDNNSNNIRRMYDEINVKSSNITNVIKTNEKIIVTVNLIGRFMNYLVRKDNLEFISGNNKEREEHSYTLTLEKSLSVKDMKVSMHCPTCGSPANVNANGICPYCGSRFNTEDFDYILTNIEE